MMSDKAPPDYRITEAERNDYRLTEPALWDTFLDLDLPVPASAFFEQRQN